MLWDVEYTDTFAGEANYCWVQRVTIRVDHDRQADIMRAAKAAVGLTGVRGRTDDIGGDTYRFRPYRCATVLFVTWHDCGGRCDRCETFREGN